MSPIEFVLIVVIVIVVWNFVKAIIEYLLAIVGGFLVMGCFIFVFLGAVACGFSMVMAVAR